MSRIAQRLFVLTLFAILSQSLAHAQQVAVPPQAPVPSQLLTAKKVFISNGGLDGIAFQTFRKLGHVNYPYDALYAAVNSWGKYTLVAAPAEADLVFEIRFTAPFNGDEKVTSYVPQLNLTIYDAKTHFLLWTILEPVQGAFRKDTFVRNMNQGIATLVADLKSCTSEPINSGSAAANQAVTN
jgi:hypothetical protein